MILNCLVVEDEEYVRKGIIYKIDWERLGLHLAAEEENGIDALKTIERGDISIVITDIRMPGMNGLELIEKVKDMDENIKFIIISGYGEFEYAKKALSYNVSDYILKPVKGAQLERTLCKVRDEILAERMDVLYRRSLEKMFKANSHLISNYYFIKLIQDNISEADLSKYKSKIVGDFPHPLFQISILKVIPVLSRQANKTLYSEKDLEKMMERLNEIYSKHSVTVFNDLKNAYEWILLYNFEKDGYSDHSPIHATTIAALHEEFGVNLIIGMGAEVEGIDNAKESYGKAGFAVKEAIVKGVNKVIDFKNVDNHVKKLNWLSVDDEKAIISYLDNMNSAKLKEYISKLFEGLSRWELKINHLAYYNLALEILVTIRKFMQRNRNMVFSHNESEPEFFSELTLCCTMDSVVKWCKKCIDWYEGFLVDDDNASGRELLTTIRKYIIHNYGQDISLNSIADKFHISPNYLSRIFKVYSAESFKTFLTKIRMEKAIELIMNSELKLYNIAEIVGYTDPKYFSKVFKGYFGFSPSSFCE